MNSVGNDIVDFRLINPERTLTPAFHSKFISPGEHRILDSFHLPREKTIWLLWSVKEAVYKCQKRNQSALIFSPIKIVTQEIVVLNGLQLSEVSEINLTGTGFTNLHQWMTTVVSGGEVFYAVSIVNNYFVFTVAMQERQFSALAWGIHSIEDPAYTSQSAAIRTRLLQRLSQYYPATDNLSLEKDPVGYPVLNRNSRIGELPISFSHHHQLVAYCYLNNIEC